MNQLFDPLYLSVGDNNFCDLFGGREKCGGILVRSALGGDDGRTPISIGASVVITGTPGSGKTLLASQMAVKTVLENDKVVEDDDFPNSVWPSNAIALYYTLDQSASEIKELCTSFKWLSEDQIVTNVSFTVNPARSDYDARIPDGKRLVITQIPHDTDLDMFWKHLQNSISKTYAGMAVVIVVDAINSLIKKRDNYYRAFRDLVNSTHETGLSHTNLILVVEPDPDGKPMMEEYVPQCVIKLGKEESIAPKRTIEISKARHQAPLIGTHEFSVVENRGICVYPSVASRARQLRHSRPLVDDFSVLSPIKFGVSQIDEIIEKQQDAPLLDGSTTLLWGPPGTRKTDLCVEFLSEQWVDDIQSSCLLLTTKVDPNVFRRNLTVQVQNKDLVSGEAEAGHFVRSRLSVIDARDPYRTYASMLTNAVDEIENSQNDSTGVRRAVIFGLGLLEEEASTRDEHWKFMSSLVVRLAAENISTVLVDWPLEGVSSGKEIARPRASKLCGNEISVKFTNIKTPGEGIPEIHVLRCNYTSIGRSAKYPKHIQLLESESSNLRANDK